MIKIVGLALAAILTASASPASPIRPITPTKPPCGTHTMPDVMGMSESAAVVQLHANWITNISVAEARSQVPQVVVFQDPSAGFVFYPCLRKVWLILGQS